MAEVSFKVSSAIKTIVGKELITDDFIAVFELVKNSFDANASQVELVFEDLKLDTPKIIIKDNGVGMSEDDIMNKWLFLAYSEKKSSDDYRDQIKTNRAIAGYKGIGRFSCDRLGEKLKLITRKDDKQPWNILDVNWGDFELDSQKEFQTIPAKLTQEKYIDYFDIEHGTILEITGLRSNDWDRVKLQKLRRSLERLINPHQAGDSEPFSIVLSVLDEQKDDEKVKKERPDDIWEIVNGPIRNFLFETLDLKTTQIQLEIDKEGEFLFTRLNDRGTLVYELVEDNPYKGILHGIKISLFHLNRAAKTAFARRMGLTTRDYGSVFLYKNGFRVHPFGDVDDDSLGIDRRKQQGFYRYLGTRDLSGRIEIYGDNPEFKETSSRAGGLIETKSFETLRIFFIEYALKRLEKYVINLGKFGEDGDFPELIDPDSDEQRKLVFDLIVKLTQSKNVLDIKYDPNVLDILENRSAKSVSQHLKNLKRIAVEHDRTELFAEITRAEQQSELLRLAKNEAEAEAFRERERAEQAEEKARKADEKAQKAEDFARQAQESAKDVSTQNMFLKSVLSKDLQHVLELHHTIGQDARTIEQFSTNLLSSLRNENKPLKREVIQATLERISYAAKKISTVSRFATKANFRADAEEITADLISYIREYLLNVYGGFVLDPYQNKISIDFVFENNNKFVMGFAPINVSIVFDNLISNSRKHKTKNIIVSVVENDDENLVISFKDDGRGIPKKNIPFLFQIGFTTTDGSGLGLNHAKDVMEDMGGSLIYNENSENGAEFFLAFNKRDG